MRLEVARVWFLIAASAVGLHAQAAPPPLGYELRYFLPGAPAPFYAVPLPAGGYTCGLAPSTSSDTRNPTMVEWDDPTDARRVCRYVEVAGGPLLALPLGNYEATLRAWTVRGPSLDSSPRAPFCRWSCRRTPAWQAQCPPTWWDWYWWWWACA
jgi:hypothetical protein